MFMNRSQGEGLVEVYRVDVQHEVPKHIYVSEGT